MHTTLYICTNIKLSKNKIFRKLSQDYCKRDIIINIISYYKLFI